MSSCGIIAVPHPNLIASICHGPARPVLLGGIPVNPPGPRPGVPRVFRFRVPAARKPAGSKETREPADRGSPAHGPGGPGGPPRSRLGQPVRGRERTGGSPPAHRSAAASPGSCQSAAADLRGAMSGDPWRGPCATTLWRPPRIPGSCAPASARTSPAESGTKARARRDTRRRTAPPRGAGYRTPSGAPAPRPAATTRCRLTRGNPRRDEGGKPLRANGNRIPSVTQVGHEHW